MKDLFVKMQIVIINCCDRLIKNEVGVIIEKGMTINEKLWISYNLDENTITFYYEEYGFLELKENSPIPLMFKEIFDNMEEN